MSLIKRYLRVPYFTVSMLCLMACAALYANASITSWGPAKQQLDTVKGQNLTMKRELRDFRQRVAISNAFEQANQRLSEIDTKLTTPTEQSQLATEFSALAQRSNVTILHSDNHRDENAYGVTQFHQKLTIEGTYSSIHYFLQLLGSTPHLVLIEEIDWKASKANIQKARIALTTLFEEGA